MTTLYTIGHGSRTVEELVSLLDTAHIECLVDVRAYPRSRRNTQFAQTALQPVLNARDIRYVWEGAALGGMRRPRKNSPHCALEDAAHRGYADHLESADFQSALRRLITFAGRPTAFMCAETQPEHCHRAFISDALTARGVDVLHLVGEGDMRAHRLRESARVTTDGHLVYDRCVQLALTL